MIKLQAPITLQMEIGIINDETGQSGHATFSMPAGRWHNEESQIHQLNEFVNKHIPTGFRLMTKREWFNTEFGQAQEMDDDGDIIQMNFAMPGGENWEE